MTRVEGSDGSATTRRCGWQRHRGAADNRARGNIHRRHARVQRRVAQNAVLRLPRLRGVTSKAMTGCGRRRWDGAAALKDGGVGAGRRGGALPFLPHLHPLALPAHPVLSTAPRAHHPGRTQQHTQSQVYTRADEQCLPRRRATTAFHVVRTPYFREEISITTSRRVRRSVPQRTPGLRGADGRHEQGLEPHECTEGTTVLLPRGVPWLHTRTHEEGNRTHDRELNTRVHFRTKRGSPGDAGTATASSKMP